VIKKNEAGRHFILILLSLIWLIPLYLLLVNAFSNVKQFNNNFSWLLKGFDPINNIKAAFKVADLTPGIVSNLFYGIVGGLLSVLFAALASFAVVTLNLKFKSFWFWVIYSVNLFPFQMFLSPLFKLLASTNLYDTRLGLLIVYTAIAIPFAFFLSRNHMLSISRELFEAAQLDGASNLRIFRQIFVPLSLSALGAAFLFQFTWIWNDLLFGLTLSIDPHVRPLMTTLVTLVGQYATIPVPIVLTVAFIVSLPTALLFLIGQRLFVAGLKAGS
jgi:multiple sugar transport system permease protein